VITETLAKKLFGSADPINKVIRLDNTRNATVTGVLKDIPLNSSLKFEYLLPWEDNNNKWDHFYATTYVELKDPRNVAVLNKQILNVISRHIKNEQGTQVFLHPVAKMHVQNHFDANGNPENNSDLYFFSVLAVVMLLIGCINFMNLSTARSAKRAREVGVRKVMGAVKRSLVLQFITESTVMALVAGIIALAIVQLVWPVFRTLAKVPVDIPWQSPLFWLSAFLFIIFTGLLAGSYPAFYLSSFKPVKVLKGLFNNRNALLTPRRVLVVTQFVIAILLINFTIIFRKQVNHIENRDPGFVKEELLFHSLTNDLTAHYEVVQHN
jgi:ABC-type antimicrobial peptide transport system permease subunit